MAVGYCVGLLWLLFPAWHRHSQAFGALQQLTDAASSERRPSSSGMSSFLPKQGGGYERMTSQIKTIADGHSFASLASLQAR